jgi:hypothetical protein
MSNCRVLIYIEVFFFMLTDKLNSQQSIFSLPNPLNTDVSIAALSHRKRFFIAGRVTFLFGWFVVSPSVL